MRKQPAHRRRPAHNSLERRIQAIADSPEGYKLPLLPYLPAWLAPATWNLWGSLGGTLLIIVTAVLVALFSIRRNEGVLAALKYGDDGRSVSGLLARHLILGIALSGALFMANALFE
ncbi:MAG: hypothetical protein ACN6P1_13735 [Pseudomonas sp.]|uniref:hypothetical protein n=1 Tax=Pseudomonas sp. TaxID=306 RepID=UPI003D136E24